MIKTSTPSGHQEDNHAEHGSSWEGKRVLQLKAGLNDSGQALKSAIVDTPMHLADAVASTAKSVTSVALATRNAVSGVFNLATAPFGVAYDLGSRIRESYKKNIGQHTVHGIHERDRHNGSGEDLALAA